MTNESFCWSGWGHSEKLQTGHWKTADYSSNCSGQLYMAIANGQYPDPNFNDGQVAVGTSISTPQVAVWVRQQILKGWKYEQIIEIFTMQGCKDQGYEFITDYGCKISTLN